MPCFAICANSSFVYINEIKKIIWKSKQMLNCPRAPFSGPLEIWMDQLKEWIMPHMPRLSKKPRDTGVNTPVVFSDVPQSPNLQNSHVKRKRRTLPPNSRAVNPVVVSVWSESPCTGRYEACSSLYPSHGRWLFSHQSSSTIAQICSLSSYDQVSGVRTNWNML